jgi:hypothetical protein
MSDERGGGSATLGDLDKISADDLRAALLRKKMKVEPKWTWRGYAPYLIFVYLIFAVALFWSWQLGDITDEYLWWISIAVATIAPFFASLLYWYVISFQRMQQQIVNATISAKEVAEKADKLQDSLGDDFVTNLVKINFKYIDKYYLQTQQQADRSFSLSLWVSVIGFIIIAAGIVLLFITGGPAAYVATGSGILGEFIAAIFFYLYNKTILSMGDYHRKLVITQNIALALKISEGLPGSKKADSQVLLVKSLTEDVNHLLTLEGGGAPGKRSARSAPRRSRSRSRAKINQTGTPQDS